jgi:PTH1 family peptidyl-tRNA hydrolase
VKLIVGLGNPGADYESTRHNVGFRVIEALAAAEKLRFKATHTAATAVGRLDDTDMTLIKPMLFMNRSGAALRTLLGGRPVAGPDLLVVHDELDLPLGRLRLKARGGDAGHRGVRSIIEVFGDDAFFRLRLGIGRPPAGEPGDEFVLARFAPSERAAADTMIARAVEAVRAFVLEGGEAAMNRLNAIE